MSGAHDRTAFTSGNEALDQFLRSLVNQYEKRRLGRTYVAVRPPDPRVWGFYTLAPGSVTFENLPPAAERKLPRHPVPVVLLARLAVDRDAQGRGLGRRLLTDALARALDLSRSLGMHAVEVDAVDADASAFYRKFGFVPLVDRPLHLYLPMATVAAAFGAPKRGHR